MILFDFIKMIRNNSLLIGSYFLGKISISNSQKLASDYLFSVAITISCSENNLNYSSRFQLYFHQEPHQ